MSSVSPLRSPQPSSTSQTVARGLLGIIGLLLLGMLALGVLSAFLAALIYPAFRLVDFTRFTYLEVAVAVYCTQVVLCPCYVTLAVIAERLPRKMHG